MSTQNNFLHELTGSMSQGAAGNPTVAMVEAAFAHHGLHWRYVNMEVAPSDLADAVRGMRSAKNYEQVMRDCIAIHEVENAGDDILHDALGELFRTEKDAIKVIKWKDIYETMEAVTDRLEDVANVMQGVIVKMS